MKQPKSTIIIKWLFYICSILLIAMVAIGATSGMDFLVDYIVIFVLLFIAWWITLFLKLKADNKQRRDRVKNFKERLEKRL